jgi:hypothetical protein
VLPRRRRRLRPILAPGVAAALVVAGILWWIGSAHAAAEEVSVGWSSGSPRCTGTDVRHPQRRPVIEAVAGMRCTVTVVVRNGSGRDVHVGRVRLAVVGPDTGAVVRAASVDAHRPHGDPSGVDATVDLDRGLAPGARTSFDVVLVFHPQGCNNGGTLGVSGWPRVAVTTWRRTVWRSADDTFRFHRNGPTPGCSH